MSAHWSLGVLIGLPLGLLAIAGFVALAIVARAKQSADSYWAEEWGILKWVSIVIAPVLAIGLAVGFFPYSAQYHRWTPIHGRVAQVSSRLLADGNGGATQRFVVQFADGQERSCDDTRCSLIRPGDTLWLSCKRSWQWAATPGWDCNFIERVAR